MIVYVFFQISFLGLFKSLYRSCNIGTDKEYLHYFSITHKQYCFEHQPGLLFKSWVPNWWAVEK